MLNSPSVLLSTSNANVIIVDANTLHTIVVACSVLLLLVNLFVTFLGSKFFSTSLILQGGILGGFVGWYIGDAIADSIGKHTPVLNLITAIGFTLFFAFFTCMLRLFMKFLFGLALGVQIGSVLNVVWLHNIDSPINRANHNTLGYVVMALLGLLLGLSAVFSGRSSHIALTAWVGSYWVVQSIGNFVGNFPPTFYPYPNDAPSSVPSTFYYYIGGWVALALVGILVQAHLAALDPPGNAALDEMDDLQLEKAYQKQMSYKQV
ncbi:hypothetical protein H257_10028 [Aphanomyces astaci]|uniref:Transmembrane protein 198 n=1 Tax=Aphanomyces astaci TaxID=112090 RepID=W4G9L6_APHAT|nr:hypothetical protein H257_10028 [Aphanomyces astaci]ETV75628.1 hypothetical protein H257_10028 [Aphanomyces astaci]|eukprot:XP_009834759.1 hypothetical protein H257_10028 [Aphanomyces astaci]